MKEPDWAHCTEEQLWKYVATHLAKNGIDTVLVGGAVVAIYTEGAYRSGDLDFVQVSYLSQKLPQLMKEIGFEIRKSRHYSHPRCKHLIVEFVSGPPGIGEDTHITPAKIKIEGTVIKLYSPTDCIRDRLASYIHFKAMECLDQAVLVAQKHPYNQMKVKKWCKDEGAPEAYIAFEEKLTKQPLPSVHSWRVCPYGEHWVKTHPMHVPPSKTHPSGSVTTRHEHCAHNPSGKDQLYPDEIREIATQHFSNLKNKPCPLPLDFGAAGSKYDNMIAGWVQYWNDVLKPDEPLDPNLVKALIASESSFDPDKLADPKDSNSARGLTQILNSTRKILGNDKGELKDHFITVTKAELNDPGVNICVGVRWLFQKRKLASIHLNHQASWIEAIWEYKGTAALSKKDAKQEMDIYNGFYEDYQKCAKT